MLVELVLADLRSNGWLKARAEITKLSRALVSARYVVAETVGVSVRCEGMVLPKPLRP